MKKLKVLIFLASATISLAISARAEQIILEPIEYSPLKESTSSPVTGFALVFDFSKIPSGYRIDLAELRVTIDSDTLLEDAVAVQVVAVTGSLPIAGEQMGVKEIETADSVRFSNFVETGSNKLTEINVTELVDWWYTGALPNKGFLVFVDGNTEKAFAADVKGTKISATLSVYYSK